MKYTYYMGWPHEFLTLAKLDSEKDFAFLTLATEEERGLEFKYEKLLVSVTRDQEAGNPSEFHISPIIVINNLP